jgi:hypothetical protein
MIQIEQDLQAVALKYLYENGTHPLSFGINSRPDVPLSCPSSNCTWPEYETLGICSACEDISDLLTFDCPTGPLDWIANVTVTNETEGIKYFNETMCGWFINATASESGSRHILMSGHRKATPNLPQEEALLTRILPLVSSIDRAPLYEIGSYHFKHVQNANIDFFVVSTVNTPNSAYLKEPPVAQECMLAWCVKSLKSKYFEATYTE